MSTREQAASELRSKISATDPTLLSVIDSLKDVFGGKLKYIRLADGTEIGNRKEFELEGIVPAPAPRPKEKGRSSLDMLKEAEAAHIAAHAKQAGAGARGRARQGRHK